MFVQVRRRGQTGRPEMWMGLFSVMPILALALFALSGEPLAGGDRFGRAAPAALDMLVSNRTVAAALLLVGAIHLARGVRRRRG